MHIDIKYNFNYINCINILFKIIAIKLQKNIIVFKKIIIAFEFLKTTSLQIYLINFNNKLKINRIIKTQKICSNMLL